jgi:MFS family permease
VIARFEEQTMTGETAAPAASVASASESSLDAGHTKRGLRRAVASSVIGSVLEWYDYYLYGTASTLVFAALFFPTLDPVAGTFAAFGSLALGYFARPLGGLFFGSLADRIGRKRVLVITMMTMGTGTAMIGLLPTYNAIGIAAPILLLICRLVQGFAAGGEFASAVVMVVEHAPQRRRGLLASLPGAGVSIGIILSSGAFAMTGLLQDEQFRSWGWRIPFLASVVVLLVGAYIRSKVRESPMFEKLQAEQAVEAAPVRRLFREQKKILLVTLGARFADLATITVFQVWILSYLTLNLKLPASHGLLGVLVANIVALATQPFFGWLSDHVGRKPVFMGGTVFVAAFIVPFFIMVGTKDEFLVVLALTVMNAIGFQAMFATEASWFSELFDPKVRVAGYAAARELTSASLGAATPLIATGITAAWLGSFWPVAIYMFAMCAVTIIAVALGRETNPMKGRLARSAGHGSD